jgi:hypothetical protein
MKKRLNEDVLVPGDIALTTTDALQSWKIRAGTSSDVSHAMLYVTHCSIIHAVGEGVHAENTQRILFEEDTPIHVMRLKSGLPSQTGQQICDYVRQIIGSEYTVHEAIKSAFGGSKNFSAKQFCSRLIAQAYDRHGYKLVNNANYCTPGDLFRSDLLTEVGGATRYISDREVEFFENNRGGTLEALTTATNFILDGARKMDPKIQTFTDVGRLVAEHPEYDDAVQELYKASGYLDVWNIDYDENPWRWDIVQMEQVPDQSSVRSYCLATLKTEPRDDNRFTKTLAGYQLHHSLYPRKTFAALVELYKKLVNLHALRVDTATRWLEKHGEPAP